MSLTRMASLMLSEINKKKNTNFFLNAYTNQYCSGTTNNDDDGDGGVDVVSKATSLNNTPIVATYSRVMRPVEV